MIVLRNADSTEPLPTGPKADSLSVFALALALLPPLAYCVTALYMKSDREMWRSFISSGGRLYGYCCITALIAVLLSVIAYRRRPEWLSVTAFTLAVVCFFFALWLPVLVPLRSR